MYILAFVFKYVKFGAKENQQNGFVWEPQYICAETFDLLHCWKLGLLFETPKTSPNESRCSCWGRRGPKRQAATHFQETQRFSTTIHWSLSIYRNQATEMLDSFNVMRFMLIILPLSQGFLVFKIWQFTYKCM